MANACGVKKSPVGTAAALATALGLGVDHVDGEDVNAAEDDPVADVVQLELEALPIGSPSGVRRITVLLVDAVFEEPSVMVALLMGLSVLSAVSALPAAVTKTSVSSPEIVVDGWRMR